MANAVHFRAPKGKVLVENAAEVNLNESSWWRMSRNGIDLKGAEHVGGQGGGEGGGSGGTRLTEDVVRFT